MPGLFDLELDDTAITDAGLKNISVLTSLQRLSLSGTAITDAGLQALKGLSRLRHLTVKRTKVTAAGTSSFQQANSRAWPVLPKCSVDR